MYVMYIFKKMTVKFISKMTDTPAASSTQSVCVCQTAAAIVPPVRAVTATGWHSVPLSWFVIFLSVYTRKPGFYFPFTHLRSCRALRVTAGKFVNRSIMSVQV